MATTELLPLGSLVVMDDGRSLRFADERDDRDDERYGVWRLGNFRVGSKTFVMDEKRARKVEVLRPLPAVLPFDEVRRVGRADVDFRELFPLFFIFPSIIRRLFGSFIVFGFTSDCDDCWGDFVLAPLSFPSTLDTELAADEMLPPESPSVDLRKSVPLFLLFPTIRLGSFIVCRSTTDCVLEDFLLASFCSLSTLDAKPAVGEFRPEVEVELRLLLDLRVFFLVDDRLVYLPSPTEHRLQ